MKKNLPSISDEVIEKESERNSNSLSTKKFIKELEREEKRRKFLARRKKTDCVVDTSSKEERILKKANSKFWKVLAFSCAILMCVLIIACLIDIFNFVRGFFSDITTGNIVGGCVTGFFVLLLIIFVIRPIVVALSTPVFTLDIVDDENKKKISRKNFKKLQKVAKNIILTNDNVSQDSKNKISTFIGNRKELNNVLKNIYENEISKDIQKTINSASTKALITTAISQNAKFDAASVIIINIKMIMQICVKCGYHPTYARLSKLIVKVFRNALIAYSVQSLNLEDIIINGIDKLAKGALSAIPGVSEISKSLTQGASNALLTLRVGIITRKYLYEEYNIQAMIENPEDIEAEIVEEAVLEANNNIDSIVLECKNGMKRKVKA